MKRPIIIILIALVVLAGGLYFLDQYWIHRYDSLIAREASLHHIDPDLVWSIVYEETYFSPWKKGRNGEIGLMQVTPVVAREWAAESGVAPMEQRTSMDTETFLRDPERNVQIGCWYLEKADQDYRNSPGREARILAAYNAGPSRAAEWSRVSSGAPPLTEQEFIARIDIASTHAYVTSILERYHRVRSAKNTSPAGVGFVTPSPDLGAIEAFPNRGSFLFRDLSKLLVADPLAQAEACAVSSPPLGRVRGGGKLDSDKPSPRPSPKGRGGKDSESIENYYSA